MIKESGEAATPSADRQWAAGSIGHAVMAISVALMVGGEVGAALVALVWIAASKLGLPLPLFIGGVVVAVAATLYLGVALFLRVMRIEGRMSRGEEFEKVGWDLIERRPDKNRHGA